MRTLTSALRLVILEFAILANFTVSMLLETNTFVWAVIVASQAVIYVSVPQNPVQNLVRE